MAGTASTAGSAAASSPRPTITCARTQRAEERFGSASEVANAFAAELGAQASRRAAVGAFASLGVAGAVYATAFVSLAFANPPSETLEPTLGAIALAVMIFAPQVSFVAGTLALTRALRRKGRVLPTQELVVIRRRTGVALTFGLVTMGALALYAYEFSFALAGWWTTLTFASTAAASVLLAPRQFPQPARRDFVHASQAKRATCSTTWASRDSAPIRGASPAG